jgi:hypothetical protein
LLLYCIVDFDRFILVRKTLILDNNRVKQQWPK